MFPLTPAAGWKTSEFAGLVCVVLVAGFVLAASTSPTLRGVAMTAVPAAWAFYAKHRTDLKKLFAALPQNAIPMDFDAYIDGIIQKFVASKIPATTSLQPETNNAIAAVEALARKALTVYVVKDLAAKHPQIAATLQTVVPAAFA